MIVASALKAFALLCFCCILCQLRQSASDFSGKAIQLFQDSGLICAALISEQCLLLRAFLRQILHIPEKSAGEIFPYHLLHGKGLDVHGLGIVLQEDLISGLNLFLCEDFMLCEELHVFTVEQLRHRVRKRLQIREASLLRLGNPFIRIAVAVEQDSLVLIQNLLQKLVNLRVKILCRHILEHIIDAGKRLCNSCVQDNVGVSY